MLLALALLSTARAEDPSAWADHQAKDAWVHGMIKEIVDGGVAAPGAIFVVGGGIGTVALLGLDSYDTQYGIMLVPAVYTSLGSGLVGTGGIFALSATRSYDEGLRALGGTPAAHSIVAPALMLAGGAIAVGGVGLDGVALVNLINTGRGGVGGYAGPLAGAVGGGLLLGGSVVAELDAAHRRTALWNARHRMGLTLPDGDRDVAGERAPQVAALPFVVADQDGGMVGITGRF